MSTDSEEEVYGGRYSLDSSPQNDIVFPSNRSYDPTHVRPRYHVYSSDVSSSVETMGARRNGTNRVRNSCMYVEDESDDSNGSSEFSTTQVPSRAFSTTQVPSRVNGDASRKDHKASFDEDIPSAPPFLGSDVEIKQQEHPQPSKSNHTPPRANSRDFEVKPSIERKTPSVDLKDGHKNETSKSSNSSLGPWHSVIAYDACVRLCLHAWAKGCMEAPMFLENECALLRSTFDLQQVLLQSEGELLAKRSSEVGNKGGAAKPKKMVGKMKVQVRKVRMALDPPTGCNFSSFKPPKVKLETVKRHCSTVQSKLSSGWQAVRRIPFSPREPINGSFSQQSLAYMQASTQYIKQVSSLLKTGVSSLRSTSSANEVLQETYSCLLRLKSSAEEDTVRMQPGSSELHIFLPDSLGDDLIVEVYDSKGNHYGRALVQLATISEDPVKF
ncbi:hypothetical protein HanOQP8_Chr10g0348411 [Helianthus annuus]|nr:hypothetical protein HanLR1_Chr10g0344331 [Helianthus annuus]KAJ0698780.1 hypothetical protein HanOQP8_Chr10g0348411 [Helianthus annuus]